MQVGFNGMYKSSEKQIMISDDFFLPFGGKLNKENRWVKLAKLIPWWEFEDKYVDNFKSTNTGEEAFSVRVGLGTLIIKTRLAISDEETVNQIAENPYLQYFLGLQLPRFIEEKPFADSLITHFRKRFGPDILNEVNERIAAIAIKNEIKDDNDQKGPPSSSGSHDGTDKDEGVNCKKSGKIILDATCTPADIQYPTDARLLNEAREKLEEIIDILHEPEKGLRQKARTYRQKAHDSYIAFTKQRKPKPAVVRKMKGKLLRYIHRDIKIVEALVRRNGLELRISINTRTFWLSRNYTVSRMRCMKIDNTE